MKESLFTENEKYTAEAIHIDDEFHKAMKAVFDKYKDTYRVRELHVLMNCAALDLVLCAVLDK